MDAFPQVVSMLSAATVGALFSAIWQGAVLAACVLLVLRLMPGLSAAVRSVVWMNVFLLLLLLHVLPAFSRHWAIATSGTISAAHGSPIHLNPLWSLLIACVWATLSFWRAAQLTVSAIRLHSLASRATPVDPEIVAQTLPADSKAVRSPDLCISAEVARPCVIGFLHPRILLPPGLLDHLTELELRQVVLHEMEHLRRGDDWTNLLQKLGLVLFPLNPVLLWVERRLCAERELACDDRVLQSTGARKAYAICLTRLAEFSIVSRSLSLVLGAWERQSELVRRVHRILRRPSRAMTGKPAMLATAGLIAGAMGCALILAGSPQLVSFAPIAGTTALADPIQAPALRLANFRQAAGAPHMINTVAVMPERPLQTPIYSKLYSQHRRVAAAKPNTRPAHALPSRQEWLVLTEWEEAGPPARVIFAVDRDRRSSFAAVAFENGWLIVQI